ncbi:hypothetical protein ACJJTC_004703 [Scirpophaga incertulas]
MQGPIHLVLCGIYYIDDQTGLHSNELYTERRHFLAGQDSRTTSLTSPKVSRKYFTNWRQACDKTKDKTKELLKRWRTLPEAEAAEAQMQEAGNSDDKKTHGWSVHVWSKYLE